jgi:acyl transferase domain-containing protein
MTFTCFASPDARPGRDRDDKEQMFESLGALYQSGRNPDWRGFYRGQSYRRVSLPTYPFQRRVILAESTAWHRLEQTVAAVDDLGGHSKPAIDGQLKTGHFE